MSALRQLREALDAAAGDVRGDRPAPSTPPTLERPPRPNFGDYSTNAAMLLAPVVGDAPRAVAERLGAAVARRLGPRLDRIEVAGPGFLNLFLADAWYAEALDGVLAAGDAYGGGAAEPGLKVNIEFVSANPTGPLHVGHARNAAYGDALARILSFHGHSVDREYYVNDAGTQIRVFGESLQARARGQEVAEDGYHGGYVAEIADAIDGAAERDVEAVALEGIELMLARARESLAAFKVEPFDTWFHERELHEGSPSAVEHAFERLRELGTSYTSEGALWLRTTRFGDDKDRVLVRSTGEHTYFASDIAYHQHKRERGFQKLIDVWGADHHGYVQRTRAAYQALGGEPDELELLIMQFVHLVKGGEKVPMSKRSGEFFTLDDLTAEIGADAARWFLLARSHDTEISVDLDLARRQSSENPVFYVQYAHARIQSVLERVTATPSAEPAVPLDASERELVMKLLAYPGEVAEAAARRAPHRIASYALELARAFTAFYERCKVAGSDNEAFRTALCLANRRVLASSLGLLGVRAPESM